MELGYIRELYLKGLRRTILQSQLFKVTYKENPPPMFSLACKLTKNDIEFLPIEISSTKVSANNADISKSKITSEKNTWKQCGFFDHRNYVKKSTWKRSGNSSNFGLRLIDVILTSNRR